MRRCVALIDSPEPLRDTDRRQGANKPPIDEKSVFIPKAQLVLSQLRKEPLPAVIKDQRFNQSLWIKMAGFGAAAGENREASRVCLTSILCRRIQGRRNTGITSGYLKNNEQPDLTVELDGWSVRSGNQITSVANIMSNIDPYFSGIYMPNDKAQSYRAYSPFSGCVD